MTMYFSLSHNSFATRGFAYIEEIKTGGDYRSRSWCCHVCRSWHDDMDTYFNKKTRAALAKTKAKKWPDIIGSGYASWFRIVSKRTLDACESEGLGTFPCFPVQIQPPYPATLQEEPPEYFRLDYQNMIGCELDYEASGYLDTQICSNCGSFTFDWDKMLVSHFEKIRPYVLKADSWNGKDIFCPKEIPTMMFCTDKFVDCAQKYQLSNFHFCPFEIGSGTAFKGVNYLKKNWRSELSCQIDKYTKNFQKEALLYAHEKEASETKP